jgi:hypothetical protein
MTETLRKELKTTVLTLAHEGKTEGRGVRGSSAFVAGFDAVWHLEANKENRTAKLEGEWLKDADDLGPHCFRVEPVYVEGMENGKGAVLRHINLSDYKSPTKGRLEHPGESDDAIMRHLRARNASNWYCGLTDRALAEIIIGPIEMWAPDESGKKDHGAHLREIERCYDRLRGRHRRHPTKGNYGPFDNKIGSMSTGAGGSQLEWRWHLCR